ncbi:porin [Aurantibacillus circumpalustris]|uniref:porin n=1 Tax=Aurantibacillus circumpalustris TaxID=3036359 RepID=UPI00295AD8BC|nr:porin [Aurantibacillus circumpalustris]
MKIRLLLTLFALLNITISGFSQNTKISFGKGLKFITKDSSMSMKLTFRFQTLFVAEQTLTDKGKLADDFTSQFMIRRARIKLDGFVYKPTIQYKVELALSNRDVGLGKINGDEVNFNAASNIILDAVIKWEFAKHTQLWVGQTKLPSNRERVISSQKLQFVDRSLLNNEFNLDRDIGMHLRHKTKFGESFTTKEIICVTLGEGRNVTSHNDDGFCYTGRFEILPFGEFAGGGDYVGSDLEREQKPKLAIGATYDYNDNAKRSRGQLGSFIKVDSLVRDIQSIHTDFMFKFKGFSVMGEYAKRFVAERLDPSAYYIGTAYNIQAGYLFKNNVELAGRFTELRPDKWNVSKGELIRGDKTTQFTLGLSKYFVKHNLKIQTDISSTSMDRNLNKDLMYRCQIELQF